MATHANISMPWSWTMQTQPNPTATVGGFDHVGLPHLLASSLNGYTSLMCIFGLLAFARSYAYRLLSWLEEYCTSTIHFKHPDESYDMLLTWVTSHKLDCAARSTIARVGRKWTYQDTFFDDVKKPVCLLPWNGKFVFRFKNHWLSYQTQLLDVGLHKEEMISITCLGRSGKVLKDLVMECRKQYLKQIENKTTVFENRGAYWEKVVTKDVRPLSTIIIDEDQKHHLVNDVKQFLNSDTRLWYAERKIPYRKGYLLYGPPGTGKSSFCVSVAGELDVDIYTVSIPSVNDKTLQDLFAKLPPKCLVLLEDIDAIGGSRSQETEEIDGETSRSKKTVTLSGLLNTLDGVASQEGRILIMTTNHKEKLDQALIRPGRVDEKAEFPLADAKMIIQLFEFIFKSSVARQERPETKADWEASQLATAFANKLPERTFSPAEIMRYLLQYRRSPSTAVKEAEK